MLRGRAEWQATVRLGRIGLSDTREYLGPLAVERGGPTPVVRVAFGRAYHPRAFGVLAQLAHG